MTMEPPGTEPQAQPPSKDWQDTFNAILGGMVSELVSWIGHRHGPVTTAEVDAMLTAMEATAARSANRLHGEQRVVPEAPWPTI